MKFINIVIKVILFILNLFSMEFSGIVNNNILPIIGNINNKLSIFKFILSENFQVCLFNYLNTIFNLSLLIYIFIYF